MDPVRLTSTLAMVLAIAGIGGALRACGSVAARGGSRAVTVAPRLAPHMVPRSAGAWGTAGGSAARRVGLRAGVAGHGAGVVAEDGARLGGRATARSHAPGSIGKEAAGNADNLLELVPDGDDDDPPARRGADPKLLDWARRRAAARQAGSH